MSELIIKQFVLGPIEDNNYLLIDEKSKEAVLIDCTEPSSEIDNTLAQFGAKLKYILLTHAHFDHVLGVNYFKEKYNCEVLLHKDDKELMDSIKEFAKNFNLGEVEVQTIDKYVVEGDSVKFGSQEIKVLHTPGHTQGGACFLIDDKIFTGDTLFYNSVGRTDLPGGNFNQLKSSIINKLFTLEKEITVYPGHGPKTTIGFEKEHNKFL